MLGSHPAAVKQAPRSATTPCVAKNKHNLLVRYPGFGDANILVSASIVKKVAITPTYHAFDENHIWNLANSLPLLFGSEYGGIAPRNQTTRIFEIENRDSGSIDQLVVGAVVNQNDPFFCHDGRRSRFSDGGIKLPRAHGQNGPLAGLIQVPRAVGI